MLFWEILLETVQGGDNKGKTVGERDFITSPDKHSVLTFEYFGLSDS